MATKTREEKRSTFAWQGKDKSGNLSKGKIDAQNIADAKRLLRRQGINPGKVSKERTSILGGRRNKAIKPLDIAFFTRQMATMMKAGVPLIQGLEIVARGRGKGQTQGADLRTAHRRERRQRPVPGAGQAPQPF